MVAATLDATAQWEAVKGLLTTSPLGADVYDYGEVPGADGAAGDLPAAFVLLTVERRYVPPNNGRSAVTGWRITTRHTGSTPANARLVGSWVTTALNEVRLTVDGVQSTPITHESTTAVEKDDGMFSGLSSWTYAL